MKIRRLIWVCGLGFLILVFSFGIVGISSPSGENEGWIDRGEIALRQALLDLTNDMTIMCLAAHPDDEIGNDGTLTYYRKKHGVRTAILYATRGEGGQNEIGPELYEELGVIRAHENQAAASVYGAEVYDLNRRDFGYSKSAEEAFKFWGHEESLARLVRVIREVRPDMIITNHDTERGHGHHRAVGIMVLEAFDNAADADKFPEQLRDGLRPWQVKRLFLRSSKENADVTIDAGEYDPPRGYSYAQIAGEGFRMHKSQGMGGTSRRGSVYRSYRLVRSSAPAPEKLNGLLDGLSSGIETPEFMKNVLEDAFIPRDGLARDIIDYIKTARGANLDQGKEKELEIAAARALDLYLTVEPDDNIVTNTQEFTVRVSLTNCGRQVIKDVKLDLSVPHLGDVLKSEDLSFEQLGYNETVTGAFVVRVFDDAQPTLPYAAHLYDDSFMEPLIKGIARYEAFGTPLSITASATVDVSEDIELHVLPETSMVPISAEDQTIRYIVNIINRMPGKISEGHIELSPPEGWSITNIGQDFAITEDQHGFVAFDVTIPPDVATGDFSLKAKALYENPNGMQSIGEATGNVEIADVKVADDLYVGYVKSYDDTVEQALKQLNVKSRALAANDLYFGDLSIYDTIILDIRAYLVREDLRASNQRLLDYAANGGNLVAMYHKTFEWNGRQYAPYKLVLSRNRVTVEEAPIEILAPNHPLLSFPNRITESDWDGWIQERGLYFPSEWAPEYKELLSCNDPDEKPLRGGYLVAEYGKGTYIYTSYVWYRQLQILNPGAFRNFANMISLPKRP
ncbi:PIG-L family deacetylase [Candidatus Poribacteria bacterium]